MGHRDVTIHMYLLFSHLFFLVMVYFSHGILDNRISFLSFFLCSFLLAILAIYLKVFYQLTEKV